MEARVLLCVLIGVCCVMVTWSTPLSGRTQDTDRSYRKERLSHMIKDLLMLSRTKDDHHGQKRRTGGDGNGGGKVDGTGKVGNGGGDGNGGYANYGQGCPRNAVLNGASGTLTRQDYSNGEDCTWTITVPNAYAKITFTSFDVEDCSSCDCDRVTVLDGSTTLDTMCGELNSLGDIEFISRSQTLTVKFHSDGSITNTGFELDWVVSDVPGNGGCGETFYSDSGVLTSPRYRRGRDYPNNKICTWIIYPPSLSIFLTFDPDFNVEECSADCTCDSISIMVDSESPSYKLCGTEAPMYLPVPGQKINITFETDGSVRRRGFQLYWSPDSSGVTGSDTTGSGIPPSGSPTVPTGPTGGMPECSENFVSDKGSITSPGYGPGQIYTNGLYCVWTVSSETISPLYVYFTHFSLEACDQCDCDKVEIYEYGMVYYTLCQGHNVPSMIPTMDAFSVAFTTDSSVAAGGFEVHWTTDPAEVPSRYPEPCGGDFITDTGVFSSPGIFSYPNNANCTWRIQPPSGQNVLLHFEDHFNVESCDSCACDKLEVLSAGSNELSYTCGFDMPPDLVAASPVEVRFRTDGSVTFSGFTISWTTTGNNPSPTASPTIPPTVSPGAPPSNVTLASCGDQAIDPVFSVKRVVGGEEATPNSWPWQVSLRNGNHHFCGGSIISNKWILTAAHCVLNGNPSSIRVVVGDHDRSNVEMLEETLSVQQIYVHPGYNTQTIDNDVALLELTTEIVYRREVSPICLGEMPVEDDILCVLTGWGDSLGTSNEILLQQVRLLTVSQEQCRRPDWNGNAVSDNMMCAGYAEGGRGPCFGDSGGPLICNNSVNGIWRQYGIVSWGFECAGVQKPGVFARVDKFLTWINPLIGALPTAGDECRGKTEPFLLNGTSGIVASPSYLLGNPYPNNAECSWRIEVPSGHVMRLHFEHFIIGNSTQCANDNLTIYDGNDMTASAVTFCGSTLPANQTSTSHIMYLVFQSDGSFVSSGFKLSYESLVSNQVPPVVGDHACGRPNISSKAGFSRIVGGDYATPHSWPWQISLQNPSGFHFCGGSIVTPWWIITAAHCVSPGSGSNLRVIVGEHNLTDPTDGQVRHHVEEVIRHAEYDSNAFDKDIALLRLQTPISFSRTVRPICVPVNDVAPQKACTATGWGNTMNASQSSSILNQVHVPVIDQGTCNMNYEGRITNNMVCAGLELGGKDSCQGDSGGPFVCRESSTWFLHGVTSWGYGCADAGYPGVYTRVSKFTKWLTDNSGGDIQPSY